MELRHAGKKGMRWGHRKARVQTQMQKQTTPTNTINQKKPVNINKRIIGIGVGILATGAAAKLMAKQVSSFVGKKFSKKGDPFSGVLAAGAIRTMMNDFGNRAIITGGVVTGGGTALATRDKLEKSK